MRTHLELSIDDDTTEYRKEIDAPELRLGMSLFICNVPCRIRSAQLIVTGDSGLVQVVRLQGELEDRQGDLDGFGWERW